MPSTAQRGPASAVRPTWLARVDGVVQSLYHNGFLQSLIMHVVLLLVLALTVIDPQPAVRMVRLALDFTAATADAVDMQEVAFADVPAPEPDTLAVAQAIPMESSQPDDQPQPSLDAVELVSLEASEPFAGIDMNEMLAEPPGVIRPAGFTGGPAAARGGGQGVGFGAGFDGELGRRLKAAGARSGDVQVSIAWDNFNDIDVHVMVEAVAPRRGISMINFSNRRGACGGWLDVDQNVVPMTPAAVENVFWARGAAPYGRYTVYVHQFRNWGGPNPTKVLVAILVDGRQSHHDVSVHAGSGPVVVTSFLRQPGDAAATAAGGFDDGSLAPSP
jgi:hypothetical protein